LTIENAIDLPSSLDRTAREELERLRDFFEHASIGMHLVGPDGTILHANRYDYDLLGYTAAEYIGHNIREFHADAEVIADILARLSRSEELHGYEARLRCKDGSIRLVSIDSSVHFVEGRFLNTRCITRDITDRVRMQAAFDDKARQLELVTNSVPALISYVDRDGRYQLANQRYEQWFERSKEQIIGHRIDEVLGKKAYETIKPHIESALAGEAAEYEMLVPYDAGSRWIHAHYVPDKTRDGETQGIFALVTDIGDRKALEQEQQRLFHEMQATSEALSAANRSKDEFLGMVSHELRTPLTTILGASQLLTRNPDLLEPNERRSMTADIHKESIRLNNIVENLLMMARFDHGQRLELEPIVLRRVAGRVMDEVSRVSAHKFEARFLPEVKAVSGNATCIEQVIRNFISNAEKYSPSGSTIDVSITETRTELVFNVADRGPGVQPDEVEQVFEPFFRSNTTHSRSGVGIGLAVCRRLMQAMGGRIWAAPREGGGSVFSFALTRYDLAGPTPPAVRGRGR
jgi:PAS domain S-box-containing protein